MNSFDWANLPLFKRYEDSKPNELNLDIIPNSATDKQQIYTKTEVETILEIIKDNYTDYN